MAKPNKSTFSLWECRTDNQRAMVDKIKSHDVVFATGPAGTGKTAVATFMALNYLDERKVDGIIATRPLVGVKEEFGFLPGDLQAKVDPYLTPIYDHLKYHPKYQEFTQDYSGREKPIASEFEGAPIALMRGRTFTNKFVILDEAQNIDCDQMKMFLTRIGIGTKVVITGDTSQIDLKDKSKSGLRDAIQRLSKYTDDFAFIEFDSSDCQRHGIVKKVLEAYGS